MARIVILITPEKKEEIAAAIEYARAHTIPWEKLRDIAIAEPTPTLKLADRGPMHERPPSIRIAFEGGVEAAISFEEQPAGIFRHLSVSSPNTGRVLNPPTFELIAREFGIDLDFSDPRRVDPLKGRLGRFWTEEYAPGAYAINVIVLEVERQAGHA